MCVVVMIRGQRVQGYPSAIALFGDARMGECATCCTCGGDLGLLWQPRAKQVRHVLVWTWLLVLSLCLLPELVAEPLPSEGRDSRSFWTTQLRSLRIPLLQPDGLWLRLVLERSLTSSCTMASPKHQVPGLDGNQATWADYVRRVKLEWMRAAEKNKVLLGASLALQLTGRAWEVSTELDSSRLQDQDGAVYLLGEDTGSRPGHQN